MRELEFIVDEPPDILKVLALYRCLGWSAAEKPDQLEKALANSHHVVTVWDHEALVALGNSISDGALVVYYPHLAVDPDYQKQGIGREIMKRMQKWYRGFHQQQVVADGNAAAFYAKCGFQPSGHCQAMWIYDGDDHG